MSEPGPSARADLVGRILGYMDKPWKVVAIAVLAIMAGAGWLVWHERERLFAAYLPRPHHGLVLASTVELTAAAGHLVAINQAAMAQVWAFDIGGNAARFIAGINKDGTAWRPADLNLPVRLPVIVPGGNEAALIEILDGNPVCADLAANNAGLLFDRLGKAGIVRICVIPIPPTGGGVLAFFIVGWLEVPDKRLQAAAVGSAVELAGTLVRE
jgi:hypothetical protein